jgi:hypothetical protein
MMSWTSFARLSRDGVTVTGDTLRPAILDIRRATAVARASQRRLKLALSLHRPPTPGSIWVSTLGDYSIVNSNHILDGTGKRI